MKKYPHIVFILLALLILSSCNKEESAFSESSQTESSQTSNILDQKNQNTKAIVITCSPGEHSNYYGTIVFEITKVEVFVEYVGWLTLKSVAQAINTTELENGAEWKIAESPCRQADLIRRVKLTFGDKNYLNADGSFSSNIVELPVVDKRELILEVSQQAQDGQNFVLNIDLGESIKQIDNLYFFKPTVNFIDDVLTGIKGSIGGLEQAQIILNNNIFTYHTFLSANGEFLIRGIEDGIYDLIILPISTKVGQFSSKIISGISIVKGQITLADEINF